MFNVKLARNEKLFGGSVFVTGIPWEKIIWRKSKYLISQ